MIIHEVIGVAMVVDEGGGPRLAFRYPWPDSEGEVGGGGNERLVPSILSLCHE